MVPIIQVTNSGEQHGLIDVRSNNVPDDGFKNFSPVNKAKMEKEKKEDSKIVRRQFITKGNKHERLTKAYCRYAGDPIQIWKFIPGRIYEIPLGLAKEINDKTLIKRSGLMEVDGEKVTNSGAPLEKDEEGEWMYKFVAID